MREIDKRVLLWMSNFAGGCWSAGGVAKGIGARDGRAVAGALKRLNKARLVFCDDAAPRLLWSITGTGRREAEAMRKGRENA